VKGTDRNVKFVGDGKKTIDRFEIEETFKQLQLAVDLSNLKRLADTRPRPQRSAAVRRAGATRKTPPAAASETRALLRTMQPSERGQLIRSAIEAGDIATAHAIISVAPFLSGMDAKEQACRLATTDTNGVTNWRS
jgi:hypothetical protein